MNVTEKLAKNLFRFWYMTWHTRVLRVRINQISVSDECIFTVIRFRRWWRIIRRPGKETQFTNRSFCTPCLLDIAAWLVYSLVNYLPRMVPLIWWISWRLSSTGINPIVRLPGADVSRLVLAVSYHSVSTCSHHSFSDILGYFQLSVCLTA